MMYPQRTARELGALETLGEAVRIARQRCGLTQRDLEALTDVDQTAISRMERARVPGMALDKFARVAIVLAAHLLADDVPPNASRARRGSFVPPHVGMLADD
jgi:transcriptional regulator with XRE-family HTH domain